MTVAEALRQSGVDPREARLLLAEATGFSQSAVVAFQERMLPETAKERFLEFVEKRKAGEPVAYIVGRKEFYGLELAVNPAVLIPRPETELLVDLALQKPFRSLVDLGTGSGALALALKKNRPGARIAAVEASAAALVVAQRNAARLSLEVEWLHGRWFEPLAARRFDLIVANPPYVAEGDPHLPELRFEPRSALVSGPDGLQAIREIAGGAAAHLEPGGWLLVEHGMGQDAAVRQIFGAAGLEAVQTWPDLAGIPRITGGKV